MPSENRLDVERRTEFGKGAARRVRRAAKIPAVIYGHGTDPVHITMPGHDTMMILKNPNALLTLVIEGTEQLALAKDIQRDPIRPIIEHIDLVIVRRGEKVTVDIQVHIEGDAAPETVVTVENQQLQLEAEATHIPQSVTVSVEGLEAGTQILAEHVVLPEGVTLVSDPSLLVVNITAMISEEALEAELAEAEEEAGIEHEAADGEEGAETASDAESGAGDGEAAAE